MKETNTDELISKYLAGEAGPEEAMELEDWKEQSDDNLAYYLECEKLFFADYQISVLANTNVQAALETVKSKLDYHNDEAKQTPVFKLRGLFKYAAAVVLIAVSVLVFNYYNHSSGGDSTTYTALDTQKKVVLEESTTAVIEPNSSLTVNEGYGKTNRLVRLKGSAYFEVTHSEQLPMLVDVGNVYVKDIGTKFKITTSPNQDTISVLVDEGIVLLYDSISTEVTLNKGERAIYIKSQKRIVRAPETAASQTFAFTHHSLKEVVQKLNAAFNTSISIESKNIEDCRLTARFTGEKLETMLEVITETLELTFIKTDNGYIIKGNRCNN
jgi:transmembrane sensor